MAPCVPCIYFHLEAGEQIKPKVIVCVSNNMMVAILLGSRMFATQRNNIDVGICLAMPLITGYR